MKSRFVLIISAFLLTACQFSLAGDVTPPPDAMISGATPAPIEIEFPNAELALEEGGAIYAQSCAPCHGATGLGDGAQAAQLPFAPGPIGTAELAKMASTASWFQMVSQGNLDRYMPPFAGQLNVQQRWNVLGYVYSLSRDEQALQTGAALYEVHREQVDVVFPNSSDLESMAELAQTDIATKLQAEVPGLTVGEVDALAAYVQSLSLGSSSVETESNEQAPSAENAELGSLIGSVQDGTDGELPADLIATVFAYDGQQQAFTAIAQVAADGTFTFTGLPIIPDRVFFVSVDYQGLSYFSDFATPVEGVIELDQPITIYETTSDTSQLAIEKLTLVFEFSTPGSVRVVEQIVISNIGDRAVTPTADGQPVLSFSLPTAASNLAFDEGTLGDRYVAQEDGFGDLRAVLPGAQSYQLLFAYDLPYSSRLSLPLSIDLPTRSVVLFIPESQVTVNGAEFLPAGAQDIQGAAYSAYVSNGAYSSGEQLEIKLRGSHPLGGGGLSTLANNDSLLAGLAALTVAVGLAWLWLRNMQPSADALIDQIITLDARLERGELSKNAYNQKRAALKQRLRRALQEK